MWLGRDASSTTAAVTHGVAVLLARAARRAHDCLGTVRARVTRLVWKFLSRVPSPALPAIHAFESWDSATSLLLGAGRFETSTARQFELHLHVRDLLVKLPARVLVQTRQYLDPQVVNEIPSVEIAAAQQEFPEVPQVGLDLGREEVSVVVAIVASG